MQIICAWRAWKEETHNLSLQLYMMLNFFIKGSAFSAYATQFFQNGAPPFYEHIQSLRRPLLYLDSPIDQMVCIYNSQHCHIT